VRRPALERDDERILDGLLGAVEVAEDAGEDRDRLPRLAPEQAVEIDALAQDAVASAGEPLPAGASS
jgi:hypothetical protein